MKPGDVRSDFDTSLGEVQSFYTTVKAALTGDKDETLLVRNVTAATLWESFVNDLFIAYINRDTTQFQVHLENAFKADRTPKQDLIAQHFVTLSLTKHMTVDLITDLIDSDGNNITFFNYDAMRKGAAKYLVAAHRNGINGLTGAQKSTLNLWIALRNHIAHGSQRSYDAMNAALAHDGLHNTGLQRGVRKVTYVGSYLKAKPTPNSKPRIELILDQMKAIAALL
ncbi:HEPN domain-containing protein [Mesorhizobium sp. CC13]|uniref:HEPN domain-containing protein n=1 Tax=Mesorhizobium sp. CC13 TaxID=3029194 RepID=UPI00326552DD